MRRILNIAIVLASSLVLSSCLKDEKPELEFESGAAIIEFPETEGTASLDISSTPVDYSTIINYAAESPAPSDIKINLVVDPDLLDAYNEQHESEYELLPSDTYTMPTSITLQSGQRTVSIPFKFQSSKINPAVSYAIPIRITDAQGNLLNMNYQTHVLAVAIKNKWHGTYQATGTFVHPTLGPRPIDEEKHLMTSGEFSVVTAPGDLGDNYEVELIIDPTTNDVTFGGGLSASQLFVPTPGKRSYYDPATKTFHLFYQYIGGGGFRVISEDLVFVE